MAWIYLILAGFCEIGWAIGIKASNGFTRPLASAGTIFLMIISFVLLSQALKVLPIGTAYTVWTGIGAVGTAIVGMIIYNEPKDALRLACIGLIVLGILGLKFLSPNSN